jgi:hypothetical protein
VFGLVLTYNILRVILKPMKTRDIVIGIVVLLILGGVIYFRQKNKTSSETTVPPTSTVEQKMEDKFHVQIPDDVSKAELKDSTGGNSTGIATKNFNNGKFQASVLADLPEAKSGTFYQGWMTKGDEGSKDYSTVSLGKLKSAKGGWMVDFESSTDYSDYTRFMVTEEKKFDNTPETKVLEGSF